MADLTAVIDDVLVSRKVTFESKSVMGWNIKWKQGNGPEYDK